MTGKFRPMLAPRERPDLEKIRYPKLASAKIDGIRCVIVNNDPRSRTLKRFENHYVNRMLAGLPDGLDGELTVGAPMGPDVFSRTCSGITSRAGEPDFCYWIFDDFSAPGSFRERLKMAQDKVASANMPQLRIVPHELVETAADVVRFSEARFGEGYEGAMLRDPEGPYKQNRATLREEFLLKIKFWDDSEGSIISTYEQMHNGNAATRNELGLTERASKGENMSPAGTLGGVTVLWHNGKDQITFDLAAGGTAEEVKSLWTKRETLPGQLVTFKYQGLGANGRPRFPIWKGIRQKIDV